MNHTWRVWAMVFSFTGLLHRSPVMAQSSQIETQFQQDGPKESRSSAFEGINRMVQNPLLASGLISGTQTLNQSVDSLMESIFYSVMDQDAHLVTSDTMALSAGYHRDLHTTSIGHFVVIDRFRLGPEFLKDLGKIRGLPLTFNAQGQIFVTNASYRSDAQRKFESQERGFWKNILANWLGILPLMSYILPPSFNPEELYDPITYLETPFLFPTKIDEALELPLGNIRSYGLSGSTSLVLDTAGRMAKDLQASLGLSDLDLAIPLSLFREGEHRITVLRRNESHVWLSLSETRRIGGSLSTSLGKHYQVLQNIVSWWLGVPAPISPTIFNLEKVKIYRIDELYDFDLNQAKAQDAFVKALHGDFHEARVLSGQEKHPADLDAGVEFQFHRITTRDENGSKQERSLYVAQSQKQNRLGLGESQTKDRAGRFFSLDAEHTAYDRNWNLLVGADTIEFHHRLSIPIRKEKGPRKSEQLILAADPSNPIYMTASLRIVDSFVDTRDYNRTLGVLRRYTGLPLAEAAAIPLFAEDVRKKLIREQALGNPMNDIYRQQITATHLGKLSANAHLYFAHDIMLAIARKDDKALWMSLARAFDIDPQAWYRRGQSQGIGYYSNLIASYAVMPIRLFGIESDYPDIVLEARHLRQGLDALLVAKDPLGIRSAYEKILDTVHPLELIQALVDMAKDLPVPILVGLDTQSHRRGKDSEDVRRAKKIFDDLNDKIFDSPWPIPPLKRDQSIEEKLASFTPGGYLDPRKTPKLARLQIILNRANGAIDGRLQCLITAQNLSLSHANIQVYIRVEQHGALNLGRFVLSEEIVKLAPDLASRSKENRRRTYDTYRIALNGPEGLSGTTYLDDAISSGGSFDIHLSLSEEGETWAPEQSMSFAIENGSLKKL